MNYFISMLSTTGGKLKVSTREILKNYNRIKKINPKKEIVIGFGITDKTIGKLKSADGLVVGSAICKEITRSLNSRQNPVTNVGKLVRKLKNKIKRINQKKEVVIGFGITEKTIGKLKSADGLVVGSAICKEITRSLKSRQNPVTNVGRLVRKLKNKIK